MRKKVLILLLLGCTPTVRSFRGGTITITPAFIAVAPGEHVTFNASGGAGTFAFAFAAGGQISGSDATVDNNGHYVAGSAGNGEDVIVVKDAVGDSATATVQVGSPLTLAVDSTTVAPNEQLVVVAVGGKPPYVFSLTQNGSGGSVDSLTGKYVVGSNGGAAGTTDLVAATDANGRTSSLTFNVGATLSARPTLAFVRPGTPNRIIASGGKGNGNFAFAPHGNHSHGGIDPITGDYTPGLNPLTTDTLQVTDDTGTVASVSVTLTTTTVDMGASFFGSHCGRADFNGDGVPEFFSPSFSNSQLAILSLTGRGLPVAKQVAVSALFDTSLDFAVGDFNADGRSDLAILGKNGIVAFFGDSAGLLLESQSLVSAADLGPPDVDGAPTCRLQGHPVVLNGGGGLAFEACPTSAANATCGGGAPDSSCYAFATSAQTASPFVWGNVARSATTSSLFDGVNFPTTFAVTALSEDQTTFYAQAVSNVSDPLTLNQVQAALPGIALASPPNQFSFSFDSAVVRDPGDIAAPVAVRLVASLTDTAPSGLAFCSVTDTPATAIACTAGPSLPEEFSNFESLAVITRDLNGDARTNTRYESIVWNGSNGDVVGIDNQTNRLVDQAVPSAPIQVDCVAGVDADADGVTDLVEVSGFSSLAVIQYGEGDATFGRRPRWYGASPRRPMVDVDADGNDDLFAITNQGAIELYLADGHEFALSDQILFSAPPVTMLADHFLSPDSLSLLVQEDTGTLVLYPIDAKGHFASAVPTTEVKAPLFASALWAFDFGGTATGPDLLAVAGFGSSAVVSVLLHEQAPTAGAETLQVVNLPTLSNDYQSENVIPLDLDGNGVADIVSGSASVDSGGSLLQYCFSTYAWDGSGTASWQKLSPCVSTTTDKTFLSNNTLLRVAGVVGNAAIFVGATTDPNEIAAPASAIIRVSASGVSVVRVLDYLASSIALVDVDGDPSTRELLVADSTQHLLHVFNTTDFTEDTSALIGSGGKIVGTATRKGGPADLVLGWGTGWTSLIASPSGVYR